MERIRFKMSWGFLLLVLTCMQVILVRSEVDFKITLQQYNHTDAERANTRCCQNINSLQCTLLNKLCDYIFEICLDSDPSSSCTTTLKRTYIPGNSANSFTFDSFARLQLRLREDWPGSVKLKVVVYDGAVDEDSRVDTITYTLDTLGNTTGLIQLGSRTSPTSLQLEYLATAKCDAPRNCDEGFFVCDPTTSQSMCDPAYVEDGICKTQKSPPSCTLPSNPAPPVAMQGYFKGNASCPNTPSEFIYLKAQGATEGYVEYVKDGTTFRQGVQVTSTSATTYDITETSPYLQVVGTPLNVTGTATVGGDLSAFTFVFDTCTVDFAAEPVASSDLCHGNGQCTKEGAVDFCCCNPGFSGFFCEKQMDVCLPNPCQGANCTVVNGTDFTCDCPAGYYGKTCEIYGATVSCSSEVCPGTTCETADGPSFSCECPTAVTTTCPSVRLNICPANMYGPNCDKMCVPRDDCEGHFTCDITTGDVMCYTGYKGHNCTERDFSGQGPDPECPVNGTCQIGGHCWKQTCCCPEGYTGINCETSIATTTETPTTKGMTTGKDTTAAATTKIVMTTEPGTTNTTTQAQTVPQTSVQTTNCSAGSSCDNTTSAPTTANATVAATTDAVTTVAATTAASSSSNLVVDNITLNKLLALLLQILGQATASPQVQAAAAQSQVRALARNQAAGDTPQASEISASADVSATSYLPCPVTGVSSDTATSIITFSLDCTSIGLQANMTASVKLVYTIVDGEVATIFEYSSESEELEKLIQDSVEKALTDNDLDVVDSDTVQVEKFPLSLGYSLEIRGTYLDKTWSRRAGNAIATAFQALYTDLNQIMVYPERVEEAIGENGLKITIVNYWVGTDGDKTMLLDPNDKAAPDTEVLIDALEDAKIYVNAYNGTIYSYEDSFGVFVSGKVYQEDVSKFQEVLEDWWQKDSGVTEYEDAEVSIQSSEKYYTSDMGGWEECTKLVYFVKLPDDSLVSGGWFDVTTPSVSDIVSKITFESALDTPYTVLKSVSRRVNATSSTSSASSSTYFREKETYGLFVSGRYTQDDTFVSLIESKLVTSFEGIVNITNAEVLGAEEVIINTGEIFSRINIALLKNGTGIDARRIESRLPSATTLTETIGSVARANGEAYVFVTDFDVVKTAVTIESCFTQTITGSVTIQEYPKFEEAIKAAVLETNSDLRESSTEVSVITGRETISAGGRSLTTLVYTVLIENGEMTRIVDASVAIQNIVSRQTMASKVTFDRPDGSPYEVFSGNLSRVFLYEDTNGLFVSTTVVKADYVKFEEKLTTIVTEKYAANIQATITVRIVQQEKVISESGGFFFKLSYVVMDGMDVVLPQAIPAIEPSRLQADVVVTNPAGAAYSLVVEVSEVSELVREDTLFYSLFTTGVAESDYKSIQEALLVVWEKEANYKDLAVYYGNFTVNCTVMAVTEFVSETGESAYKVSYSVTVDEERISSFDVQTVSVKKVTDQMANITNPQGKAYEVSSLKLSTLVDMSVSTSIVLTTSFAESQTESMTAAIIEASSASLSVEMQSSLEVRILRQREVLIETTGEFSYAVDYQLIIGDQVTSAAVLPALEKSTLESTFNLTTGISLEVLDVLLTEVVTVEKSYSLTLNYDVQESSFASFKTIILGSFEDETVFASSTVDVVVVGTEEAIDVTTGVTYYSLRYIVKVDNKVLDARINTVITSQTLTTKITAASLTSVNGEAYTVITTSEATGTSVTSVVRKSMCASVTMEGSFSQGDTGALDESVSSVLNPEDRRKKRATVTTKVEVTTIQQREQFSASGESFTIIFMRLKAGRRRINSALLDPIPRDKVLVELNKKSLVKIGGYKLASRSVLTSLVDKSAAFSFLLDAAVVGSDVTTLETRLTASFKARAEFTSVSQMSVKVVRQSEMFTATGVSSRRVFFFVRSAQRVVRSRVVKRLSITELTTSLSFSMSSREGVQYKAVISADQTTSSLLVRSELQTVTLDAKMSSSSFTLFESSMTSVIATASGLASPTLKVITQEEFVDIQGKISYKVFFSVKSGSRFYRSVDVRAAQWTSIRAALTTANIKTAKGVVIRAVETSTAMAQVRVSSLFSFSLTTGIQVLDKASVELALVKAYAETNVGVDISTVSVKILRQAKVVNELGQTFTRVQYSVRVKGKLQSSLIQGRTSTQKIISTLSSVTITGSTQTYSSKVEAITAVSVFKARSLVSTIVSKIVTGSARVDIEAAMKASLIAGDSSLASQNIKVSLVKQEEVVTASGKTKIKLSFGVVAGSKKIDYSQIANFDMTTLETQVQASAVLVAAGIQVEKSVDIKTTVLESQATTIFFKNVITKEDREKILIELKDAYNKADATLATANVKFVSAQQFIGTNGEIVTGLKVFVETADGQVIKQSLSRQTLEQAFSFITTSRQERLTVVQQTSSNSFVQTSTTFSIVFTQKIKMVDYVAIEVAVAQAWNDKRTDYSTVQGIATIDGWKVTIIGQQEGININGNLLIRVSYTVSAETTTTVLNAQYEESISSESIRQYLQSVSITGESGQKYSSILESDAVADNFVAKADLCLVVMDQMVAPSLFADVSATLVTVWKSLNVDFQTLTIAIKAQEEMIWSGKTVYGVRYQAQSPDADIVCPDFKAEFLTAFSARLSLTNVFGQKLTVSPALSSELVLKSTSYSFLLSSSINLASPDLGNLQTALATAWNSAKNVDVSVQLAVQDEMLTLTGQTVWRVHFFVREGTNVIDALTTDGLTEAQLRAALSLVTVGTTSANYGGLLVSVAANSVFLYDAAFYLHLTTMVSETSITDFKLALRAAWKQTVPDFASKTVDIKILKQEEIVDSLGTFSIRLVYALTVDSVVQDSRLVGILTSGAINTNLQGKITGPGGAYVILTSLRPPLNRLALGLRLYLDGMVPNADNVKFELALRQVYSSRMGITVTIKIVYRDLYIKQGKFVTALVYFVHAAGLLLPPSTLPELTASMRASIEVPSGPNVNYKLIDDITDLLRFRDHFSVHLSRPVLTAQLNTVLNGLLAEWKLAQPGIASDMTIVMGLQEKAVLDDGAIVWRLVYFLKKSGDLIPSATLTKLTAASVTKALDITITGALKYSSFIVEKSIKITRLADLMVVALNSRPATSKMDAIETVLKTTWDAFDPAYASIDIKIMTQDLYISRQGEKVYLLFYKASLGDMTLSGMDFSLPNSLLSIYLNVISPQGVAYTLYTDSLATLRSYKSAFSFFINRVVKVEDTDNILSSLESAWRTARSDLQNIKVETAIEEEFLEVSSDSVYKFLYFVSADDKAVDALFDAPLTKGQVSTALSVSITGETGNYNQFIFTGEIDKLVAMTELINVPFIMPIALPDYTKISDVIQAAWRSIGAQWADVTVEVRAQEEFLDEDGQFVHGLLYSVRKSSKILALEDLPDLPDDALDGVELITGPSGPYKLSKVVIGELRRYKLAMHIFLDKWVSFDDQVKVALTLQNMIKGVRAEYFSLRIEQALQEWAITKTKDKVSKYVFFGYLGTRLLDGRREAALDKSALAAKFATAGLEYTILSTTVLEESIDTRMTYKVFIDGMVASVDVPSFSSALEALWKKSDPNAMVKIVLDKEEYIGKKQQTLTGLIYSVTVDDKVLSPQIMPGPEPADLVKSLVVTSQTGKTYTVYTDMARPYSMQYSVTVMGHITNKGAMPMAPALKIVWQDHEETNKIDVTITKVEANIGEYGVQLTKVLYSVSVDGKMTFPADRLAPSPSKIRDELTDANLKGIRLYMGITRPVRLSHTYSLVIEGEATKDHGAKVLTALGKVWGQGAADNLVNPTYKLVGQQTMLSVTKSEVLSKILYQVLSNGKPVAVEDVVPPSINELETELRASAQVEVFGAAAVRVRNMYLSGVLLDSQRSSVEAAIQASWTASNVGATVKASLIQVRKYVSSNWTDVTQAGVAVEFNGGDPTRDAVAPSTKEIDDQLSIARTSLCGCSALMKRELFLTGASFHIRSRLARISRGIKNAWVKMNPGIGPNKMNIKIKPILSRRRRQARGGETDFVGPDGQFVTPIVYTVDVGGQEPDPVFLGVPDALTLDNELLKAAGVKSCGCTPLRCTVLRLQGETKETDKPNIIRALREAYAQDNPDVREEDIDVTISDVTNDKRDPQTGMVVSEVRYCVDSQLVEPTVDVLKDSLKRYGKNLYTGDITGLGSPNNQWIMIIGILCGAVALVLVVLAVIKVCYRHRRRHQEKSTEGRAPAGTTYSSVYGLHMDEEVYAGHATYNTPFKQAETDSVYYMKGQMYDPRAYMSTPGNMMARK